jgi:hypothetical protein
VLGLDPADRREDPRVDSVAGAGLGVEPQVGGWDLGAGERGRLMAGGERLQPEDRGEDPDQHQPQQREQAGQQRERDGREAAAGESSAGERSGRGGERCGHAQAPTLVTVQRERRCSSSSRTV